MLPNTASPLVLDTNIFVAAHYRPESASARVVSGVKQGKWRMAWTATTRAETRAVLERIPGIEWQDWVGCFRSREQWTANLGESSLGAITDPADRKFAVVAVAAGAVLISSDRHLLEARPIAGLRVLTPAAFLRDPDR